MRIKDSALLNCLMYYDGIVFQGGITLQDNILDMKAKKPQEWQKMMSKCPGLLEGDKAEKVINAILEDETLSNLKVLDCTRKTAYETGPVIACFLDEKNKTAIFTFRGTNGKEWMDNGEAFLLESSRMQKHALKYVEDTIAKYDLVEKGYAIDVTGHSKGGNKAQYVTIKCPHIRECYSYDGQGFSPIFLKENQEAIQARQHKITTIASHEDYVHSLAHNIAGQSKWFLTNESPEKSNKSLTGLMLKIALKIKGINTACAHAAGAIFHFENGKFTLNKETTRSDFSNKLHQMTLDIFKCSKVDQTIYYLSVMGVIQALNTNSPMHLSSMISYDEIKGGIRKLVAYLTKDKDRSILRELTQSKTVGKLYSMAMEGLNKKRREPVREVLPKEKYEPLNSLSGYTIYQVKNQPKKHFIGIEIEEGKIARLSSYIKSEEKCGKQLWEIAMKDPFNKKQSEVEYKKMREIEKEMQTLESRNGSCIVEDFSNIVSFHRMDRSKNIVGAENTSMEAMKRVIGDRER